MKELIFLANLKLSFFWLCTIKLWYHPADPLYSSLSVKCKDRCAGPTCFRCIGRHIHYSGLTTTTVDFSTKKCHRHTSRRVDDIMYRLHRKRSTSVHQRSMASDDLRQHRQLWHRSQSCHRQGVARPQSGATQVAISSTDLFSYGNLFQWGRGADGHQVRTSGNIPTQATDWLAGSGAWNGSFITVFTNWLSTGETHMWSGTAAENNPCPSGFRLPTNAEWEQERLTWSPSNSYGAFASPLKLPMAGYRLSSNGGFSYVGNVGSYWSSTANGSNANALYFTDGYTSTGYGLRGTGSSVRCIKD